MIRTKQISTKTLIAVTLAIGMALSACASKPNRKGPSQDRQGGERPNKSSGTFMQPVGGLFLSMDENNDKIVSKAEARAAIQSEWQAFGSRPSATYFAEWSVASLGSTEAMPTFMSFDRDFNGTISEEEFVSQLERDFDRLDKNRDETLERSEMLVSFEAPRGRERQQGGGGGEKKGGGGGRPPPR